MKLGVVVTANYLGLNPLKRVNSILTLEYIMCYSLQSLLSQSPQTGQFNSYALVYPERSEKI